MEGLQADQACLRLPCSRLCSCLMIGCKVYVQFHDSSCLLGICCALPAVQHLHHRLLTCKPLTPLRRGSLDLCLLQVPEG